MKFCYTVGSCRVCIDFVLFCVSSFVSFSRSLFRALSLWGTGCKCYFGKQILVIPVFHMHLNVNILEENVTRINDIFNLLLLSIILEAILLFACEASLFKHRPMLRYISYAYHQ